MAVLDEKCFIVLKQNYFWITKEHSRLTYRTNNASWHWHSLILRVLLKCNQLQDVSGQLFWECPFFWATPLINLSSIWRNTQINLGNAENRARVSWLRIENPTSVLWRRKQKNGFLRMLVQFSADCPLLFKFMASFRTSQVSCYKDLFLNKVSGALLMAWQLTTEDKKKIKGQPSTNINYFWV